MTPFRGGIDGRLGILLPNQALALGIDARFGWQVLDPFAIVLEASATLGVTEDIDLDCEFNSCAAQPRPRPLAPLLLGSILGEFSFVDRLVFVEVGPSVGYGSWSGRLDAASNVNVDGVVFGLDLKAGVTLGKSRPGAHRTGTTLGLDLICLLAPGAQRYAAGTHTINGLGTTWMIAPSLVVGFDAR